MALFYGSSNTFIQVNCKLHSPEISGYSQFSFVQQSPVPYTNYSQENTLVRGFGRGTQFTVELACNFYSDQDRPLNVGVLHFGITALKVENLTAI